MTEKGRATNWRAIPDWKKFPELVWLERLHIIGPITLVALLAGLGFLLAKRPPAWAEEPAIPARIRSRDLQFQGRLNGPGLVRVERPEGSA